MRRLAILVGLMSIMGSGAAAQAPAADGPAAVTPLAPGLAMVTHQQRNVVVSTGADGTLLVDAMYARQAQRLDAALASLGAGPVRLVVVSHWHHDHADGARPFVERGATMIAHDNVRRRLATEQFMVGLDRRVPPSPPAGLPRITYRDELVLHLNGDTVRLVHAPGAHTDGDTLVYWRQANVLQMGDLFNRVTLPFIGLNEGGSLDGMIAAAKLGLAMADADTRVVPGHGAVATQADLQAFHDMLTDIRGRVAAGVAAGRSLEEIVAEKPAARYGADGDFVKPDLFVALSYYSLIGRPMPRRDPSPR